MHVNEMNLYSIFISITFIIGSQIDYVNGYTLTKTISLHSRFRETVTNHGVLYASNDTFEGNYHDIDESVQSIDTLISNGSRDTIIEWIDTITKVERSKPYWLEGGEIMAVSPSEIIQSQLEEMFLPQKEPPCLFPTLQARSHFDQKWREIFITSFDGNTQKEVIDLGRSNTHPLRLQLVAVPRDAEFGLHAHAGVEMAIPLVGELRERRARNIYLPKDILQRTKEQRVGEPGSIYSTKPTPEELQKIGDDLAKRSIFEDHGDLGIFVDGCVQQGEVLINDVGSVHQSYTTPDHGCLFFGLAANLHVHFLPGKFKQRKGVEILTGIESLLDDTCA